MDFRPDADFGRCVSRIALVATGLCALGAVGLSAQIDGCAFGDGGRNDGQRDVLPGTGAVFHVGGPHFVCDDGSQIFADSSITYEARDMHHLIGNVRYFGEGRQLNADEVRYFSSVGRMQATGNVSLVDEEGGSTIRNGDLVLLLTTATRDEEEMTVVTGADGVRPIALIAPPPTEEPDEDPAVTVADAAQSDTVPPTPYTVVSDRMFIRGAGSFTASGTVEIVRDSLFAWADSAEYGRDDGGLHLAGAARVESATYELLGETITMGSPGSETSEVRAQRAARLLGDDLELTAAQIVMLLRDDALERLVATPIREAVAASDSAAGERPRAVVEDFVLRADSLEVNTPGERVERVFASGRARSESMSGDSLNVEILPGVARTDWLEGDTIIVTFVPDSMRVPGGEEDDEITVDQIVARVAARSLYRLAPSDTTARLGVDPPAVHYVTGAEIRILMNAGEVSRMNVVGQTRGIHLEPLSRQAPPDSATVVPDTTATPAEPSRPPQTPYTRPRPSNHALAAEEAPWTRRWIR